MSTDVLGVPPHRQWVAGVGSRSAPRPFLKVIRTLAADVSHRGYGLRSGGAIGADQAWEAGARSGPSPVQIFLAEPRRGIEGMALSQMDPCLVEQAHQLASQHHPAWSRLDGYARKLMARNCFQVLGPALDDPVAVVLCWATGSHETSRGVASVAGGTGLAVRLAFSRHVPVLNLAIPRHLEHARRWHHQPTLAIECLADLANPLACLSTGTSNLGESNHA